MTLEVTIVFYFLCVSQFDFHRNPKHFASVLDFVRHGSVELPESLYELCQLRREAAAYRLDALVAAVEEAVAEAVSKQVGAERPALKAGWAVLCVACGRVLRVLSAQRHRCNT